MASSSTATPTEAKVGMQAILTSAAVLLATIMVILDMTVVNVNLADMKGALGANSDQITWVLTSYIVAEAVIIPLGGTLSKHFGRKRLMVFSVIGFVIASALCGQARSLDAMIIFRTLQGAFGASIVPLSQSVMVDTFPPEKRGRAMAFWGIGIMLGPILGPTLGGFIAEHLSWRWVFYINVPVGILNVIMLGAFLKETKRENTKADWLGAGLLALGIGSLQAGLDQGNQRDWLSSGLIQALFATAAISLTMFVMRSIGRRDAVLRISLLKDRNLSTASFMMLAFGLGMFGTIALQPIMMSEIYGFPSETIGLVMAPRGFAAALGMFTVASLINRTDPRYLVSTGFVLSTIGSWMMSWLTPQADAFWVILPSLVQGLGMGMIFVPLSTLAFSTLKKEDTDFGSGIFNLSRTIGSSIGISITSTVLSHSLAEARSGLSMNMVPSNPNLQSWYESMHLAPHSAQALQLLASKMSEQAAMIAFNHTFIFIASSFIVLGPLILLLRRPASITQSGN